MGDALFGKVVVELFDEGARAVAPSTQCLCSHGAGAECPRTAKNFRWICSGDKGKGKSGVKVHYKVRAVRARNDVAHACTQHKGSPVHRVAPGKVCCV